MDIATVAAAVLAAIGLIATASSVRSQARSNDLNSLFQVTNQLREAEARLGAAAVDPKANDAELVNYLNLMETLATAVNGSLFGKATRKIASNRLMIDIAILLAHERTRMRIEKAITSETTFQELGRFGRAHRAEIQRLTKIKQEEFRAPVAPEEEKGRSKTPADPLKWQALSRVESRV